MPCTFTPDALRLARKLLTTGPINLQNAVYSSVEAAFLVDQDIACLEGTTLIRRDSVELLEVILLKLTRQNALCRPWADSDGQACLNCVHRHTCTKQGWLPGETLVPSQYLDWMNAFTDNGVMVRRVPVPPDSGYSDFFIIL